MNPKGAFIIVLLCLCLKKNEGQGSFAVIPLGVLGGGDESNLSSYLVGSNSSDGYICLDAGTIRFGIQQAIKNKVFSGTPLSVMRRAVKAYLISHPHLDHLAGLIINAPDDTNKNIYGLPFCLRVIQDKYFNWDAWANFGNAGEKPLLNKYHYMTLDTARETQIDNTDMYVRPFLLSHSNPYQSTAFLIRWQGAYLLYFGDTGADPIEKSNRLQSVWKWVAPLIRAKKLKAIFIECSFPDSQPARQLFGHLTPALLMEEIDSLSQLTGIESLEHFPVVITHIKPGAENTGEKIQAELRRRNAMNLELIFPKQGEKLVF